MDDWGFDNWAEEPVTPPQATTERELVPEGRHKFKIERAGETDTGLSLTLAHADKRFGWVWPSLPKGADWAKAIVATLLRSLGLTPADWGKMDPGDLVGRMVEAEVYHRIGNTGKTFVNVRKFHATETPAAPAEEKPAPKRTQAAKAHAEITEGRSDAIPF